jgi:hypothetical protein
MSYCQSCANAESANAALRARVADLERVLRETADALFSRCGDVPPATDDERKILDRCAPILGWFGHAPTTPAEALARQRARDAVVEAANRAVRGWQHQNESVALSMESADANNALHAAVEAARVIGAVE